MKFLWLVYFEIRCSGALVMNEESSVVSGHRVCQCRHVFQGGGQSVERGGGERGWHASHAGGAAPLRNTSRCAPRQ